MKQITSKTALWLTCIAILALVSCSKDSHGERQGLAVSFVMPNDDAIDDIQLWIFNSNDVLENEYSFESAAAMARNLLPLVVGKHTVVTGTNFTAPFSYSTTIGTTKMDELLVLLTDAKASPSHAHYGIQAVNIKENGITQAVVKMNRALAELQFSIRNVPTEVVSVEAEVLNCAKGFYPATGRLTEETAQVDMGKQVPVNGDVNFPLLRVMPVVEPTSMRAVEETKTHIRFIFTFNDGKSKEVEVIVPIMQNGGSYAPEVEYDTLKDKVIVDITSIPDWVDDSMGSGEAVE